MMKRSITQRWLINSLGIILLILIIIEVGFSVFIQQYYYNSAQRYLESKMTIITNNLTKVNLDNTLNYSNEIRKTVENFAEKDQMELIAIDINGNPVVTSSGFQPSKNIDMTDYKNAKDQPNRSSFNISNLENGEKVLSYCVLLDSTANSKYTALKIVTSLKNIDSQIIFYIVILTIVFIAIIMLMVFSGLYFVKSIVIPIRQIGNTARLFATGDFSMRIKKKNDDELGQLCDIINSMADELSTSETVKNEFISSVSHELRTPLTAIKGWSETLNEINDPETVKKGMQVITSETERLSQMVEELLDFSRIQNGKFTLNKATMDILAELGDAVLIFQKRAYREKKNVVYYEPEMLPFVYGDKNRIRQVFINIIDNALKYSDMGDTVTIDAFEEDEEVVVTISDTGCGIKAEDLQKVKTKFYKANHSRRGSGIGLAVADEIINMHGGDLTLDSKENVGTTVRIALPAIPKKSETISDVKESENSTAGQSRESEGTTNDK